jgi:hypothetical protein
MSTSIDTALSLIESAKLPTMIKFATESLTNNPDHIIVICANFPPTLPEIKPSSS